MAGAKVQKQLETGYCNDNVLYKLYSLQANGTDKLVIARCCNDIFNSVSGFFKRCTRYHANKLGCISVLLIVLLLSSSQTKTMLVLLTEPQTCMVPD